MLIHTYTLSFQKTATQMTLYLTNEEGALSGIATVKPGSGITWFKDTQTPQGALLDANPLFDPDSDAHKTLAFLLGDDALTLVLDATLSFVETTLGQGYDGVTVEILDTSFALHAKSKTQTNRTGAPRPKVRNTKTRIWI